MKEKKLQIFISSTFKDLILERQAAVEAILSSGHIPAGMELFSAGDESQLAVIKRWIDESDIFLLIVGGRYGSIEKTTGKSYTQLEFEYALERKKPLFAVVISQDALESKVKTHGLEIIEQENPQALIDFKNIVIRNLIRYWDDVKDIKIAIHETISEFSYRKELVGWIKGDNSINAGFLVEEIARLTKENSELRNKLINIESSISIKYAGLTYEQMKTLLENEKVFTEDQNKNKREVSLFDYFISNGEAFSQLKRVNYNKEAIEKLILFKLIEKYFTKGGEKFPISFTNYRFTEDGQHFFVKSISINSK